MKRLAIAGLAALALAGGGGRGGAAQPPSAAGCSVFPADNIWNTRIDALPRATGSATWVATIGAGMGLHMDFGAGYWPPGSGSPIGIPWIDVPGNQPPVPVLFEYEDESDPGPYPIPPDAPIEGGPQSTGDRHILVLDRSRCLLYELYAAYPDGAGGWEAGSGAIFDLYSHRLRPAGWTSADAAGLAILPGLVRYQEVAVGEIRHALRFTAPQTRRAYVWPARHFASSLTGSEYPAMGQRFRLRSDFDLSGYSATNRVILRALQRYGMMLADNGSAWFLSGAPDERWDNEDLAELGRVTGADFEAVDVSSLRVDPDSGQVASAAGVCIVDAETLCLNRQRFRVTVRWRTRQGTQGSGKVVPFGTDDSGLFYFFREDNWELLVKVLDGCGVNGRYWVFAAATTDVRYTLTVTDSESGTDWSYTNPQGVASPAITDTHAFASCP